jgi:quinoprotein glucose dehydrogenase
MTSPPTVVGNVVVVGSIVVDNQQVDIESGAVRGYDTISGKLLWTWESLPWAEKQKIRTGAGNVWSVISADPSLGMVYLPRAAPRVTFMAACAREITAMPIRSLPWMLRRRGFLASRL